MKVNVLSNENGYEQIIGSISPNSRKEISDRKINRFLKRYGVSRTTVHTDERNIKIIDKYGIVAFL